MKNKKILESGDYMKRIPKNYYNEDFIFMKKFLKIKLTDICSILDYDRSTITMGNGTEEQYKNIRREIEKRIASIYLNNEEL